MNTSGRQYDSIAPPSYPRRFSWPMRLFLTFFVFWMSYRCFAVLLPMSWWTIRYELTALPKPLPTAAERVALWENAKPDGSLDPIAAACLDSAVDVIKFWNPWPSPETRDKIHSPMDAVRCAAAWLNSRFDFLERLAGIHQEWKMFAPNAPVETIFLRARLCYDDDTDSVVRQLAEPEDLTRDGHAWLESRITRYDYWSHYFDSSCWGYCNLLAHRYPRNDQGAQLVWIVLMYVSVEHPAPGADALVHYQKQNLLTMTPPRIPNSFRSLKTVGMPTQIGDYYEFNVATRAGKKIQ